ncbi:MAG: ADP-ribosylglycohydrolase family protein [Clostridiales bacterium]|nr:ADP-ribosylglycohydrolase family protein [Candidatus Cacconaster stercorequi]
MYGAILGDIIGSPYEFTAWNYKAKDFPLFSKDSTFTDDSVMTLAVAEVLMESGNMTDAEITEKLFEVMPRIGRHYPDCGYGRHFGMWIMLDDPCPYNSYGNGSAMRVASVAWLYDDLETVLHMAEVTANVSHNHPEGVKGAQAVAAAIFLARTGRSKEEIRSYVTEKFGYDLTRTCNEIRPDYCMDESCQGSVPEAIIAFLESTDFEDAIRTAVSIGGDSDTIADMAGAIAEGFYGVPEELKAEARNRLPDELKDILLRFEQRMRVKEIIAGKGK